MIKNRTRARNREFTKKRVTPRHFVTPACDDPTRNLASSREPAVVVSRCYQPEATALEALVEALYGLLMDAPVTQLEAAPTEPEPTCFSGPPE
jgi:hypothetical protein